MRQERIQLGQDVAALLTGSDYLFFVTYKGLKVKDVDSFKKQLAPLGAECHVLKNRFITKMAELNGLTALAEFKLTGDTAMISGKGDAGPVAKAIRAAISTANCWMPSRSSRSPISPARTRSALSCLVSSWLSRPALSAC